MNATSSGGSISVSAQYINGSYTQVTTQYLQWTNGSSPHYGAGQINLIDGSALSLHQTVLSYSLFDSNGNPVQVTGQGVVVTFNVQNGFGMSNILATLHNVLTCSDSSSGFLHLCGLESSELILADYRLLNSNY